MAVRLAASACFKPVNGGCLHATPANMMTASCPCVQSTSLLNTPLLTQSLKSSVVSRNAQLASSHTHRWGLTRVAADAAAAAVAAAAGPAMTQQQMSGVRSKGGTGVLFLHFVL